jgi:hypothetical protein
VVSNGFHPKTLGGEVNRNNKKARLVACMGLHDGCVDFVENFKKRDKSRYINLNK